MTNRILSVALLCSALRGCYRTSVYRTCYAVSGTDIGYAATRVPPADAKYCFEFFRDSVPDPLSLHRTIQYKTATAFRLYGDSRVHILYGDCGCLYLVSQYTYAVRCTVRCARYCARY
eukprot:3221828-Rhodomonas_salina.3